jgi:transcriptional regulator of heat shock response
MNYPLSPRQQSILNRVIDRHITTAQPVGSHAITEIYTELYQGSYSSATVRHEMGALEEMGYLTHPHTSAGRVPTDLGYRYYVDQGMREEQVTSVVRDQVAEDVGDAPAEPEVLADKVLSLVSDALTEMAVLVFQSGRGPEGHESYRLLIKGTKHLFQKPELQDLGKIKKLFGLFEEKIKLTKYLLSRRSSTGVSVTIGRENPVEEFSDFSIIVSRYYANEEAECAVAVIAPRRMPYAKTLPLLTHVTHAVTQRYRGRMREKIRNDEYRR